MYQFMQQLNTDALKKSYRVTINQLQYDGKKTNKPLII